MHTMQMKARYRMRRQVLWAVGALALWVALVLPAAAQVELSITRGTMDPLPIAITRFGAANPELSALANDMAGVIEANLQRSGLFLPVDRRAFIENITSVETIPHFPSWRQINAKSVLTGELVSQPNGQFSVKFRLWDALEGKQYTGKSFTASRQSWRRVAHMVSDEVYSRLTGEAPYFDTRIVYVAESGDPRRPTKRLAIMDQDGANHMYLTNGRHMVLTPRFDKAAQRVIYLSYQARQPSVYLYDLETGREELLGRFSGMSFAPRFSHDGRRAVMSVSQNGNTEIYIMDIASRQTQRLTRHPAIDTSPSFSPDDRQVVFNSDREGSQQIYIMDVSGGNVRRISRGNGSYATPVWSPRGDLIAFTKMYRGQFHIGVMRPDGSGERILTTSYLDEGPTWSPNGRVIIFSRKMPGREQSAGKTQLMSIDLTGHFEQRLPTPVEASDPAWSPLLSR